MTLPGVQGSRHSSSGTIKIYARSKSVARQPRELLTMIQMNSREGGDGRCGRVSFPTSSMVDGVQTKKGEREKGEGEPPPRFEVTAGVHELGTVCGCG